MTREFTYVSKFKIILVLATIAFFASATLILIFPEETNFLARFIVVPLALIVLAFGTYVAFNTKIKVDDEKLQLVCDMKFFKTIQTIFWRNIDRVGTDFMFFPQIGLLDIHGKTQEGRNKIGMLITGMPIGLLKEILSKIGPNVSVDIYPWLQKKLDKL